MPKQEPENDLCRCCHSEGVHKNLYEAHSWLDEEEVVYSKLLQDCFDIEMATVTPSLQHMLCTICDSCIEQLQDAVRFKRQVLKCEKRFRDVYGSCVGEETTFVTTEVKVKQELDVENEEGSFNGASANTSAVADSSKRLSDDDDDDDGLNDAEDDFKPIDEDAVKVKEEVDKSDSEEDLCLTEVGKRKAKAKPGPAAKKAKATPSSTENREDDDDEELAVIQENRGKTKPKKTRSKKDPVISEDEEELVTIEGISVIKAKIIRLRRNVDFKMVGDDYQCLRCSVLVKNERAIGIHVKSIHLKTAKYKCPTCFEHFWSLSRLVKHKLEEHDIDQRHKCNACDKVFLGEQALTNHRKGFHMLGEKLKCEMCEFETYNKQSFSTHKKHHSTEKELKCQYCQKAFKRKYTLSIHERIHTGDKRKACAECGKAFIDRTSLKYHMTRQHPGVPF